MKTYHCDLCDENFNQKSDYVKHKNRITPCISLARAKEIEDKKNEDKNTKNALSNIFKYSLNVLRDNESLTGDKALRTLAHLLILKLIEPKLNEIDLLNDKYYDFSDEKNPEYVKQRLFHCIKFSNLVKESEDNIHTIMSALWDHILSVHPKTKDIFNGGDGFRIKKQSTFKKIIDRLNTCDFDSLDIDVQGEAYEEVIKDIMTGKVLGQFFTPSNVKNMMIRLIDPKLNKDGSIETIYDPAMGTGGFLISSMRYLLSKSKKENIKIDWKFITEKGLCGREAETDTFQLAKANMLISTGHMCSGIECGDSIRDPNTNNYDIILANPPFGIDGMNYIEITHKLRNNFLPIKSNSAVPLFLQAIIYMLKINGRCAIVLPDGKDLFGKNNELINVREYLMKTCDLKEVIYLPAGIFTHTTIKTCVFYFIKKRNCEEVLQTEIKISKISKKETNREQFFTKTHQTTKVNFYEYNPYEDKKTLLLEVPIDKIKINSYSLNYSEYLNNDNDDEDLLEDVIVKNLEEVCNFEIGGTPNRSNNEYYKNGNNLWISVKELNGGYIYDTTEKITDLGVKNSSVKLYEKDTVLFSFKLSIGKTGIVGKTMYSNEAIAGILSKNTKILDNKYLYYHLTLNDFTKNASGMLGNGSLNKKSLAKIKILIPPIDKQKEIVEYLDYIYENNIIVSNKQIEQLKKLNVYCLINQKKFGDNKIKKLSNICEFKNGQNITKDKLLDGDYPVVGGGQKPLGYHNEYNVEENTILISKDGAYAGFISKYSEKVFVSNHGIYISSFDNSVILKKYLYYYLKLILQEKMYMLQTGTAQPGVNKEQIAKLNISIPSIKKQKEIIEYCEFNDGLIEQIEKSVEKNKLMAQNFVDSITKNNKFNNVFGTHDNSCVKTKNKVDNNDNVDSDCDIDIDSENDSENDKKLIKRTKKVIITSKIEKENKHEQISDDENNKPFIVKIKKNKSTKV